LPYQCIQLRLVDNELKVRALKGVVTKEIRALVNEYKAELIELLSGTTSPAPEAQKLVSRYFATYAGIHTWLRQTTEQTIKSGYASTLAGRKRFFTLAGMSRAQRATIERAARNHPIQGTNADILKRALALLSTALPERVHLLLCVHDEIVLECPEDLLQEAEQILKEAMVQACRDFLKVVAIPEPEVVVGHAWIKK
jgi:DNA polymerase-1